MALFRSFLPPRGAGAKGLLEKLSPNLTINGTTKAATFKYIGKKADGVVWIPSAGLGETLDLEAGTAPTLHQPAAPNLSSRDQSILFNAGGYYQDDGATFGDITTEDFVFESVFKYSNTNVVRYFSKKDGANTGYRMYTTVAGPALIFDIEDGNTDTDTITSGALSDGTWYHFMVFVNRDEASANGSQIYIDGVASGAGTDFSAVAETITSPAKFTIAASPTGSNQYDSNIAYLAMWKQAAWHQAGASGPAEWVAIALARAQFLRFA